MAKIASVKILMVDLVPPVPRSDAIQAFTSQETPIVRITDAEGVTGTGYSYGRGRQPHPIGQIDIADPPVGGQDAQHPFVDLIKCGHTVHRQARMRR